jgi:hypothetical protein
LDEQAFLHLAKLYIHQPGYPFSQPRDMFLHPIR